MFMAENIKKQLAIPEIKFNKNVKLIITDVDETIADIYLPAEPAMTKELSSLLQEGKSLFFVTGQSVKSLQWRIIDQIPKELRKRNLIGHCSGAEVWGFDGEGNLRDKPFYSLYESLMNQEQKDKWRKIVQQITREFNLNIHETMPIAEFKKIAGDNPREIMLEDRGPQITLEVVNGYNLTGIQADKFNVPTVESNGVYDFRIPMLERTQELLNQANIPITPRLAGEFALDMAIKGVNKTTAIKRTIEDDDILATLGLTKRDLENPENMEVWGDKFSAVRGGTDRHISEALPRGVRSIDFREENPSELEHGYNIVLWKGKQHLHHGTLEYLQSRHT
jgi:hydroxymethylpyrimidine pyrophosphatase-like HAD family hydrolase